MDLSEVHGAIDAKYGDQASDQPEKPQSDASTENQSHESTPKEPNQAVFDLSKAEKFLFEGKEYTLDQLKKERLMMSDYTRKTQEIAEERRQIETERNLTQHFKADLPKVLQNPDLIGEMARHYPPEMVALARQFLEMTPRQQQEAMGQGTGFDPKSIQKLVEPMMKPLQDKIDRYETETLTKQLDSIYSTMKGKYPSADEEFVTARLQALDHQRIPITQEKIEETFKYFHDKDLQAKDSYHKEQLKKQSEATKKAKDVASGGGTPGVGPKRLKLSEVPGALKEHLLRGQ